MLMFPTNTGYLYIHLEVSWNAGTPKSCILIWFSIINQTFWVSPRTLKTAMEGVYAAFASSPFPPLPSRLKAGSQHGAKDFIHALTSPGGVMADRGRISGPCRSENHREMMGQYGITYLCLVGNGGMIHNISIIIPATPIPIQSLLSTSKIKHGEIMELWDLLFFPYQWRFSSLGKSSFSTGFRICIQGFAVFSPCKNHKIEGTVKDEGKLKQHFYLLQQHIKIIYL